MYKSHCSCTGKEQVSVFVQDEICSSSENNSCCVTMEIEYCTAESPENDCNTSEITYVKLINKVVMEDLRFTKVDSIQLLLVYTTSQLDLWETEESLGFDSSIDPPPIHISSNEFLISIQQLKIPSIA